MESPLKAIRRLGKGLRCLVTGCRPVTTLINPCGSQFWREWRWIWREKSRIKTAPRPPTRKLAALQNPDEQHISTIQSVTKYKVLLEIEFPFQKSKITRNTSFHVATMSLMTRRFRVTCDHQCPPPSEHSKYGDPKNSEFSRIPACRMIGDRRYC